MTEYYYVKHPIDATKTIDWGDFADQDDRAMIISLNTTTSSDKNSSYSTIHTSITQHSIQTFYDPAHADKLNGFGLETYNESPLCGTFGSSYDYSSSENDLDGLVNFKAIFNGTNGTDAFGSVAWSNYLNTFGWTESVASGNGDDRKLTDMYVASNFGAWYACLSRNRDLDGDGNIDETEVFWYLPAVEEYILLMLGENALTNQSHLFFGDKSTMTATGYPNDYLKYGALYFTSSRGSSQVKRIFWAAERAAYGKPGTAGGYSGELPLRCVRRLPVELEDHDCAISEICTIRTTNADDPTSGNYIADLSNYFENEVYRTSRIASGSLNPHNEDDVENKLYYGFVVPTGSEGYITATQSTITNYDAGYNLCGDYYEKEDASDKGAWRVPNLSELIIISQNNTYLNPTGKGTSASDNGLSCCTQFSNQSVRLGFQYATNISCIGTSKSNYSYTIRCVRDATDDELTNSTVVTSNTLTTD